MVLLHSDQRKMGDAAPDFNLPGVDGKQHSLESFASSKVLVVMFICNHCPYVVAIEDRIIELQRHFEGKSVQLVGICANDPTDYPDDSFESLKERWQEKDYRFPYLVDESQEVAKAYGAVCTPDLFVFDEQRKLAYHGRLDDSWKDPSKVTRQDLKEAVEKLLNDEQPDANQISSMGCSIKWKK